MSVRIARVYALLREVSKRPPESLEAYELEFQRMEEPAGYLKHLYAIVIAVEEARSIYPPGQYDRRSLYLRMGSMLAHHYSEAELSSAEMAPIVDGYWRAFNALPSAVALVPDRPPAAGVCTTCCWWTAVVGADFCGRCGRRLAQPEATRTNVSEDAATTFG